MVGVSEERILPLGLRYKKNSVKFLVLCFSPSLKMEGFLV